MRTGVPHERGSSKRSTGNAAKVTYARINDAIDVLGAALRRGSTAAVTLVNVESARLTAAYFEAKGMRASLYERHCVTCIGVCDRGRVPRGLEKEPRAVA